MKKSKLHELIKNLDIDESIKKLSLKDLLKYMFFWNHSIKTTISGSRLTSAGFVLFSMLERPYYIDMDSKTFKCSWIVYLGKNMKFPWYFNGKQLILFDKKPYCEILLTGSLSRYLDNRVAAKNKK